MSSTIGQDLFLVEGITLKMERLYQQQLFFFQIKLKSDANQATSWQAMEVRL